eukprot:8479370-Pyramimonas_sp.AAC.1
MGSGTFSPLVSTGMSSYTSKLMPAMLTPPIGSATRGTAPRSKLSRWTTHTPLGTNPKPGWKVLDFRNFEAKIRIFRTARSSGY